MDRDISQVPVPVSLRKKLYRAGFSKFDCFQPSQAEKLSQELEIKEEEAKRLVEKVRGYSWQTALDVFRPITAFELLRREQTARYISTGSTRLDSILGGGIALGRITEFSGVPGVGKTQLCLQLCVNVQTPENLQGIHGEAVFIDTEGGFYLERIKDIAEGMIGQLSEHTDGRLKLDVDTILKRIFYVRCHDFAEVVASVHQIEQMLNEEETRIKLIIIDSIAAPFRYAFENIALRSRILNGLMQTLVHIAVEKSVAVVVSNQMTTRINPGEEGQLIPALGTSWGHSCGTRVNLFWKNESRMAFLFKSPSQPENMAPYTITRDSGSV
ncbi:DNA repair protein RAD51 homolog 3-like isoform X2 [Paramacrobiotus metropolitanus]|uniref:DNA repair protein RAD51 homolog 3-like isoform X2 n=1 Tax=Paramacrobiotus metropolitanus TaxID=2943436 RepID=UPI002446445C|nr:DNA repair protein RAD51 homolog 3-like isoform X2 [Paramacrobiotus metropolitanus]